MYRPGAQKNNNAIRLRQTNQHAETFRGWVALKVCGNDDDHTRNNQLYNNDIIIA